MLPSGFRQKFSCRSAPGWVLELILEKEMAQEEAVPLQCLLGPHSQPGMGCSPACPSLTRVCVGSDSSTAGTRCLTE